MKKVFVIILSLVLMLQFAIAVGADAQYATAGDLYQAWMAAQEDWTKNPYPDYVCGVWSTDGGIDNLTVAVTNDKAGEAGKEELLALIERDETITFTDQTYSYKELLTARLKIEKQLGKDNGMHSIGISEMENKIFVGVDETNPNAAAFMQKLTKEYGDLVVIEISSGPVNTLEGYLDVSVDATQGPNYFWILLLAGMTALCAGGYLLLHQRKLALQTANGGVQTVSAPLTRQATEDALRACTAAPKQETLNEILEKLP